jgi:serine/threonine-protein kinase
MNEPTTRTRGDLGETASEPPGLSGRHGRYEILRLLGRGGMGEVHLARQTDLGRLVVIKLIKGGEATAEGALLERFRREAQAAAQIDSDNAIKVWEAGRLDGLPFISMEYVDGATAAGLLSIRGRLDHAVAATIALGAARGLKASHDAGVIHRDVKPANILVSRDGRVKVADFGLAKFQDSKPAAPVAPRPLNLTAPGSVMGTPAYMSPEQADGGDVDGRTDVYALGVTFFQLLTGRLPFRGPSALELLKQRLYEDPESPTRHVPSLPAPYEQACLRLLAREPAHRPDARHAIEILEKLVGPQPPARAIADLFREPDPHAPTVVSASAVTAYGSEVAAPGAAVDHRTVAHARTQPERARAPEPSTLPPDHPSTAATWPPEAKAPRGDGSPAAAPVLSKGVLGAAAGLAVVGFLLASLVLGMRSPPAEPSPDEVALANAERAKHEAEERDRKAHEEIEQLKIRLAQQEAEQRQRDLAEKAAAEKAAAEKAAAEKAAAEKAAAEKAAAEKAAQEKAAQEKAAVDETAAAEKAAQEKAAQEKAAQEKAAAEKAAADKAALEKAAADQAALDQAAKERADHEAALRALADRFRQRIVDALAARQSSKVAAVRDELRKAEPFPERDDLVKVAADATKLLAKIEDIVKSTPASSRPNLTKAAAGDVFAALVRHAHDRRLPEPELKQAATLLGAVEKVPVPEELFVAATGNDSSAEAVRRILKQLRLDHPKSLPKPEAPPSPPPGEDDSRPREGGNDPPQGNGPGGGPGGPGGGGPGGRGR